MAQFMTETAYSFAQSFCAAFSCPDMNTVVIIADTGIILSVSFIILSLALLLGKEDINRTAKHSLPTLPIPA